MFIQKTSFLLIVVGWLISIDVSAHETELILDSLMTTAPSGPIILHKTKKYLSADYCPDETCEVLRISNDVDQSKFKVLVAAYFYFFNKYIYLKEWQQDIRVEKAIETAMSSMAQSECINLIGKPLARCEIIRFNIHNPVQVFFRRCDESGEYLKRISLHDALK